jgi:acyl-CoA synthetase (AMP-forming)/AMP-acid ligase II
MGELLLKELSRYEIGTFADIIYRNALLYPGREAFKCRSQVLTFSDFNGQVNRLVNALYSLGIKRGDVIGILSWNCMEYAVVYGAAMKGGFIISPFNARLKAEELNYIVNYSEAVSLFVGPELTETVQSIQPQLSRVKHVISLEKTVPGMAPYEELLISSSDQEPEPLVTENDPLFIFYTSGTTGVPRGALYDHGRAMEDTKRASLALGLSPDDRQIQIMPLFHIGGTTNFWHYYFVGGSNVIMPQISFDPKATLKAIQDEKATDIHIVPTHLAAFLALPKIDTYDLSSLKRMFYAASPMPVELLSKGMEKWGPIFVQAYGASEDGPNVTMLSKQQHNVLDRPRVEQKILASAGLPNIGVHVRIVNEEDQDLPPGEVGEIIVKSKSIMLEWWRKPDETSETIKDGWVHTGDLGRYDHQGYIYIVDRKKDMIISGGENIFPREIEEVLYRHPAVQEATVIGLQDDYWVEKVHALVVLKRDVSATERELIAFCKQHLAGFKSPKSVAFVESLPKSPAGKILKRVLREKYRHN